MAGLKETIYSKLPYPFKFVLLNIKGYLNTRQRYNKEFEKFFEEHNTLWNSDIETVLQFQKKRLIILLSEACKYSQWYGSIMKDLGIKIQDIKQDPFLVLKKMPILEKTERTNHVDSIVNTSRETAVVGHTSGTTGTPTIDYIDVESINISFAIWKRFHQTIGVRPQDKQVRFSGRFIVEANTKKPPFWVYNYSEKQLFMSTYHLTYNNLIHYVNRLIKFKPELMDGYPSAFYILSKYINDNNIILNFSPKAIVVTAETLYDYQRFEIEKAFNCHVYNQYASHEGSPFITECVKGNLHLNIDSGVFEFMNLKGKIAKPGEIAKLIVTSFINYKTPLIRYSIEDMVLLSKENESCDCGCEMPIIEKIIGREDDLLWTKEKGFVVRLSTAFKGIVGIDKAQVVQETPGIVNINLMTNNNFNKKMEALLIGKMKDRLGENISYKINFVDDIPLGPNGKFDSVKRNFKLDF